LIRDQTLINVGTYAP